MEALDLRPGAGAGKIRLGFSSAVVRGLLGQPPEIDEDEWIYDNAGIAVTFENDKAVSIDAYADEVAVDGKVLPPDDRTAIADLLDDLGWGQPQIECDNDGLTEFWRYRNGVTITFRGEAIDNITIEAPGRVRPNPPATPPRPAKNYTRRRLAFWAVFFATLSAIAFAFAVKKTRYNAEIRTWPLARATVTRIGSEARTNDTMDGTVSHVYYTYTVGTDARSGVDIRANASAYNPGDVVTIRYAPDREESYIESEIRDATPTFTFAVIAALASLALLVRLGFVIKAMRAAGQSGPQARPKRG